jgi:fimbrial chaperone protein
MSATIGVDKKNNSVLFYLENDTEQPIAISASVISRTMDINGVEKNAKCDDELMAYPSQLIIPANEKRSIKVSWIGKSIPEIEKSYRLIAEQLPIDIDKKDKKKASIRVLLRYAAALYVEPKKLNSKVSLEKFSIEDKFISFHLKNSGGKHQILSDLSIKVSGKKSFEIESDDLKGMTGENVLAASERIFKIPKEGKLKDIEATDSIKIKFEEE